MAKAQSREEKAKKVTNAKIINSANHEISEKGKLLQIKWDLEHNFFVPSQKKQWYEENKHLIGENK